MVLLLRKSRKLGPFPKAGCPKCGAGPCAIYGDISDGSKVCRTCGWRPTRDAPAIRHTNPRGRYFDRGDSPTCGVLLGDGKESNHISAESWDH